MAVEQAVEILVHSTRLFPKDRGAAAYRITGIAERCDWAIVTDGGLGKADVSLRGDLSRPPRTVFLSLRSFFHAIPYFYKEILPRIEAPFVLISGSEDLTLPNQIDPRFRRFTSAERDIIGRILGDERLIHWFAENRDEDRPKLSSLPLGNLPRPKVKIPDPEVPIRSRPLKMLCAHRSAGWEQRQRVTRLCEERFKEFSTVLRTEVPYAEFKQHIRRHPFVLCVQGGGLDPSTKAWETMVQGSIPIVRRSTLDDAYSQLPVAVVEDWSEDSLSIGRLREWLEELGDCYEGERFRTETLYKLSLDYWWNKIVDVYYAKLPRG